jgi:hypothetical protein
MKIPQIKQLGEQASIAGLQILEVLLSSHLSLDLGLQQWLLFARLLLC